MLEILIKKDSYSKKTEVERHVCDTVSMKQFVFIDAEAFPTIKNIYSVHINKIYQNIYIIILGVWLSNG